MNANASHDIVAIGDILIDAFLEIKESNIHTHLTEDSADLCFKFGEKIQVDKCTFLLGGNACNVSVGLARAGINAALSAETGDDEFAQKIMNLLSFEKVDRRYIKQTKRTSASFAIGINFKGERTLFVEHVKREHDFPVEDFISKWFYLTSMGNEWKSLYQKVYKKVLEDNVNLAFNPGTIQIEEGLGPLRDLLKITSILFINKTEAQKLLETKDDMKILLSKLKDIGPKNVVITDGKNGSYSIGQDGKTYYLQIFNVPVIEKTGAGDAYTSGFLSAILLGKDLKEAMVFGTLNAASVVGQVGAQPGLLTKEELEKRAEYNNSFQTSQL